MNSKHVTRQLKKYPRGEETHLTDLTLWRIGNDILEVSVSEGVDGSARHVRELFDYTYTLSPKPTAIVINRENDYSVDLSILWEIRKNVPFELVAMVNNGRKNQYFPMSLWPKFLKLAFFNDRTEAIDWLSQKLSSAKSCE